MALALGLRVLRGALILDVLGIRLVPPGLLTLDILPPERLVAPTTSKAWEVFSLTSSFSTGVVTWLNTLYGRVYEVGIAGRPPSDKGIVARPSP